MGLRSRLSRKPSLWVPSCHGAVQSCRLCRKKQLCCGFCTRPLFRFACLADSDSLHWKHLIGWVGALNSASATNSCSSEILRSSLANVVSASVGAAACAAGAVGGRRRTAASHLLARPTSSTQSRYTEQIN